MRKTRRDIMKNSGNGVTGNRLFLICLKLLTSLWKGGNRPNEAEKHWGIFNEDRTPKLVIKK